MFYLLIPPSWSRGKLTSKGPRDWLAEGTAARLPPRVWLPTKPVHDQGAGDHLPQTIPLKQSRGSGDRPPVWGCCHRPPSAPRSVLAPTSAEPPRTAPCLSTGRRKGRVRPPAGGEQPGPTQCYSRGGSEERGGRRAPKDHQDGPGQGPDHFFQDDQLTGLHSDQIYS